MKLLNLLQKSYELAVECGDDELSGSLAEYLAAARGEWGSFDQPDPELVAEINFLFSTKVN